MSRSKFFLSSPALLVTTHVYLPASSTAACVRRRLRPPGDQAQLFKLLNTKWALSLQNEKEASIMWEQRILSHSSMKVQFTQLIHDFFLHFSPFKKIVWTLKLTAVQIINRFSTRPSISPSKESNGVCLCPRDSPKLIITKYLLPRGCVIFSNLAVLSDDCGHPTHLNCTHLNCTAHNAKY